jgi:4-amino-4-deoxy-L-arabinose transferase-like glycosyltransferase
MHDKYKLFSYNIPVLLIIVVLWGIFFINGSFALKLMPPDEPKYASAAEVMLGTGDFLTPTFNCKPRFDKPPMIYWFIALSYSLVGISDWAARIPSILASLGVTLLIYIFCKKEFDQKTGVMSAIVFSTFLHVWVMGRAVAPEMVLVLFMTASIYCLHFGLKERRNVFIVLGYFFSGLAFMTKGPLGALIPFGVVFLYCTLKDGFVVTVRRLANPVGIILFLAVILPWYLSMMKIYGYKYFSEFFLFHNIYRFTGKARQHSFPFYYYIPVFLGSIYLWLPLLPSCAASVRDRFRDKGTELFLFIWFAFVFLFFTISVNKLHNYILIAYPPVAILLGLHLTKPDIVTLSVKRLFAGLVIIELAAVLLMRFFIINISAGMLFTASIIPLISFIIFLKGDSSGKVCSLNLLKAICLLLIINLYFAGYAGKIEPAYEYAYKGSQSQKDSLYSYRKDREDFVFYAHACVSAIGDTKVLDDKLKEQGKLMLIAQERYMKELGHYSKDRVIPFEDIDGRRNYIMHMTFSR